MDNLIGKTLQVSSRRGKETITKTVKVLSIEDDMYNIQDMSLDYLSQVSRLHYDELFLSKENKKILPKNTRDDQSLIRSNTY